MPLISLSNANVILEGYSVFNSLDFALEAGQSVSLTGANGAGKTTLLRVLSGELWPVPAESRQYGFGEFLTWSPLRARQQIAFVSPLAQEKRVRLGHDGAEDERGARLSVRECVATGWFDSLLLTQAPTPEQEAAIEETLCAFSLDELAARDIGTLSQGQLRRVLLARALVKQPCVVLLDEAASGLDEAARAELFAALEPLAGSGTTFVFASHRAEELPAWTTPWSIAEGRLHRVEEGAGILAIREARCATEEAREATEEAHDASARGALFSLQKVSVFLEGASVLRDLDWVWPRGVHLRVSGENGSGKTTLLRLLGGELSPAHGGEIVRLGDVNRPIWEWRRRIALVSPLLQARFHDAISVREAIASGWEGGFVAPRELPHKAREAIDQTLDEWALSELAERRFDRLSYGQTRRVLLARSLVSSPEVVLLDEALHGLDSATRAFCFAKWRDLARRGTHFAFASHHSSDFPAWAMGKVRLEAGRIVDAKPIVNWAIQELAFDRG